MPIGEITVPRWKYEFSCKNCKQIHTVHDEAKSRHGEYCIASINRYDQGLPSPIHADDDRVIRCDCYEPKG